MTGQKAGKPVIGVVGGVGSGKSTAAAEFAALGCAVIDADAIGHDVLARAEVKEMIRQRWGQAAFGSDGQVDREALAEAVFQSKADLEALNGIAHPPIGLEIRRRLDEALADPGVPAVVLDAAVMFESGWDRACTHLVFVDAPAEQRQARAARRGWDRQRWLRRENSQISLDTKRARCYFTLDNSSGVPHLREQVRTVFQSVVPRAE